MVKAEDLKVAAELPDVDEELGLEEGWDKIIETTQ